MAAGMSSGQVKFFLVCGTIFYLLSLRLMLFGLPSFENQLDEHHHHGRKHSPHVHPHVLAERRFSNTCKELQAQLTDPSRPLLVHPLPGAANWFKVLSAYLDTRHSDSHFVRLLVAMSGERPSDRVNIHCHVPISPTRMFTTPAVLYQFNENHGMHWGGWVLSCPLPPYLLSSVPQCYVRVTNGPEPKDPRHLDIPLKRVSTNLQLSYNFSVCVPPLFGKVPARQFAEFVEVSRKLGAQQFFLYDYDATDHNLGFKKLVQHYVKQKLVTVRKWSIDLRPGSLNQMWYKGQMLAIHHCLYANMGVSKYTMFQDIDELLVPKISKNWEQLMADVDSKNDHCGYRFFSAFFAHEEGSTESKSVFSIFRRTQDVSRVRTKCMVRPDLIFEMGIHHMSKQNVEIMTPQNVKEDKAVLHHYRHCDSMWDSGNLCRAFTDDRQLLALVKKVPARVDQILRTVDAL